MRLKMPLALLFSAICLLFTFVACGPKEPEDSTTEKPPVQDYTVTFHYGLAEGGTLEDADADLSAFTAYKDTMQKTAKSGKKVTAPTGSILNVEGYKFMGWDSDAYSKNGISENLEIRAMYRKLQEYTYTFKNVNGTVIKTGKAYEGSDITQEVPNTSGVFYDTLEKEGYVRHEFGGTSVYILEADIPKLGTHVAMPIGFVFDTWSSSNRAKITNLSENDTVFTAVLSTANAVIPKVALGTITKENMLDKSLYGASLGSFYKNIISNKIDGTKGDFSIIDKYADLAAAKAAGKGDEYSQALETWNRLAKTIDADYYMAWDGEFIYFLAEVSDDVVTTQSEAYCVAIDNPYENDGVELWYAINEKYHKLCLDALGYKLYSGWQASAYLNYINTQGLFATKLTGAEKPVNKGAMIIEGATGYTVAFALPAYAEPADAGTEGFELKADKSNWGEKLTTGSHFYVSLQIDNLSGLADQTAIDQSVQDKASKLNSLSSAEAKAAMARINLGWQSQNKVGAGTLCFVLG